MSKLVIKFWDRIVVVLLGVVGLSSIVYSCMKYGDPAAEYCEINGVVTDKETSNPIQNIQVVRWRDYSDTTYTDADGKYAFGRRWKFDSHIKFEDIDGEANGGEFETQEIDVKFTEADLVKKGKGNKTADRYVKTQNIELEHKK